jgi:hypothetical protein
MDGTEEHHLLKMSLRRPKAICSPSYMYYRPTTHATIWTSGNTKVRPCMGGIEQGKETKNLNVFDVLTVHE